MVRNKTTKKTKKKIVLFGLNGRGGTLHYCSRLANALSKLASVSVVLPSYSDKSLFEKDVTILSIYAPPNIIKTAVATCSFQHRKLIRKIKDIKPDYAIFLDDHPWYIYYSKKLLCKFGFVINDPRFHSGDISFPEKIFTRRFHKYMLRKSDKVIILSKAMKKYLLEDGVPEKKIVISRIGEYSFVKKNINSNIKQEKNTILFFGRIAGYKGVDVLIDAVKLASKKIKDIKCIIAGAGDFSEYAAMIDEEHKKNFEIHNRFIDDNEIGGFFQRASVVVLPYKDATQTGVIQIAYSFGKPVIATSVGGLPDMIKEGKTGYLINPDNVNQLTEKIEKLLKNVEKTIYSKECLLFLKSELSWSVISKNMYSDTLS